MNVDDLKRILQDIKKLPVLDEYTKCGQRITEYDNGNNGIIKLFRYKKSLVYYYDKDGKLHNENGPARILFSVVGNKFILDECVYYIHGLESRKNGPSCIYYHNNRVSSELYKVYGKYNSNLNKPSIIEYYDDGVIRKEEWRNEKNCYHRENGPAVICYNEDGSITAKVYYYDGRIHRVDGEAFSNQYGVTEHYLYGEHYNTQKYYEIVSKVKKGKLPTNKDICDMTIPEFEKYMAITKGLNNDLYEELSAAHLMLVMLKNNL